MKTGELHTNAIEDQMLIEGVKLDFYGDALLRVNFAYHENLDESMVIVKVSERKKYHSFEHTTSLN